MRGAACPPPDLAARPPWRWNTASASATLLGLPRAGVDYHAADDRSHDQQRQEGISYEFAVFCHRRHLTSQPFAALIGIN